MPTSGFGAYSKKTFSSGSNNVDSGVTVTTSSILSGGLNANFATLKVNNQNVVTQNQLTGEG